MGLPVAERKPVDEEEMSEPFAREQRKVMVVTNFQPLKSLERRGGVNT